MNASWFLCALLVGCTIVSPNRTEGWPVLKVTEHYISGAELRAKCDKYSPFGGSSAIACMEFDLRAGTCDIWAQPGTAAWALEHERKHCHGYDHAGGNTFTKAVAAMRSVKALATSP